MFITLKRNQDKLSVEQSAASTAQGTRPRHAACTECRVKKVRLRCYHARAADSLNPVSSNALEIGMAVLRVYRVIKNAHTFHLVEEIVVARNDRKHDPETKAVAYGQSHPQQGLEIPQPLADLRLHTPHQ